MPLIIKCVVESFDGAIGEMLALCQFTDGRNLILFDEERNAAADTELPRCRRDAGMETGILDGFIHRKPVGVDIEQNIVMHDTPSFCFHLRAKYFEVYRKHVNDPGGARVIYDIGGSIALKRSLVQGLNEGFDTGLQLLSIRIRVIRLECESRDAFRLKCTYDSIALNVIKSAEL